MLAVLVVHIVAALIAPTCVRSFGRNAFYPLALVPLGGLAWVIANWGHPVTTKVSWAPQIGMNIDLRLDSLAAIMATLVLGVGTLVLVYCARYFERDEARLGLFAAELLGFAGAMFGLVTSDNMLLMYVFWEITTVLSFLLVGHYAERSASRRAAIQALLVTASGGLAMLVGIVIIGLRYGSFLFSDILATTDRPGGFAISLAVVLVLIGALSKSAIVPLHFWLPGAMAAPTPVSAYLHAAAMVKAGVYLVARLAPAFATSPAWHVVVLPLGITSLILAGWRAMQVHDLKLVLAFGTVSQLGLMITVVSVGTPDAALAGMTLVVAHAMFKACLFMVVGIIDHGAGTRDLRALSGLGRREPWLFVIAVLAAASMAGLPPMLGFVGKESTASALWSIDDTLPSWAGLLLMVGVPVGAALTVAYSARFIWGAFGRKPDVEMSWHSPGFALLAPPALLAVGGIAGGIAAPAVGRLLAPYAETLPGVLDEHLALWHGFNSVLVWTLFVIALGCCIFLVRNRIAEPARPRLGNADRNYDAALNALDRLSVRLTGALQSGSLPESLALILGTLIVLPMVLLAVGAHSKVSLRLWDSPWQGAIGLIMIAMALGATMLRNRLASVLVVGITGYGCGVIFALHGAPDLALTQFLVETLLLVTFVLVLRAFPAEISHDHSRVFNLGRAMLGCGVGATVVVLAIFATAARSTVPIWEAIPGAAYTLGGGKNAVNVLLVDIRAWDTLGEISVLVVAATGVASLVFRSRRFGSAPRAADAPNYDPDAVSWLPAARLVDRRDRSMVLQITTRLVFPTIMVLSVYFFFAGHNAPGGGFAGGLVAGLALTLRYLAGGRYELGEALPVDAGQLLGAGLAMSAGTATMSLLFGAPPLSSAIWNVTLPVLGHIKIVSSVFFDLGVYLIVVGLTLDVLRSLGARLDKELS
ncbi:Na+/H+ antiporter subunit A [Nocardia camponoti]|uniref:Na+/H+ antiporter subunit A n=1 Tax=Nocardia camponoti TaxID=1616106 RepID=UPI00166D7167|nr:Na+/H+ antiporter subunit A [Nocardia camponoti]